MKHTPLYLTLAVIVLSVLLSVTALSSPARLLGDLDRNDRLDSADIRLFLRYTVGERSLTASDRTIADCDGNGRIDTRDARYVLQVITEGQTPSTVTTLAPTTTTTIPTKPPLDSDGYYDDLIKP